MPTPNLDELRSLSSRLQALLEEAHPGLSSWQSALYDVLKKIAEFVK